MVPNGTITNVKAQHWTLTFKILITGNSRLIPSSTLFKEVPFCKSVPELLWYYNP